MFIDRFYREEKLLGPNEKAACEFVLDVLRGKSPIIPGDVVQMSHGGPLMTVIRSNNEGMTSEAGWICGWFTSDLIYDERKFLNSCLVKIKGRIS